MRRAPTPRSRTAGWLTRRLGDAQGSMLIEVMMSATIVLIVGFGVLQMVDRTNELSGQQRSQAIAGNLAQAEIETVKSFPLSTLSNMRRTAPPQTVGGVTYTITTRADWINDTTMTPNCTTPGATADYLKVQTTVTHDGAGTRDPAVLDTLIAPPVRSFSADEGSLAVGVTDSANKGVEGLVVSLTGPAAYTETTNANGCILWGYLPVGTYTISFAKAEYLTDGGGTGGGTAIVKGDKTTNANFRFERGGSIRTNFKVRRTDGTLIDTSPTVARVDDLGPPIFSKIYALGTTSSLDTAASGLLYPFSDPYAVYADSCPAAKPPSNLTSAALTPGASLQAADTILPALNVTVTNNGTPVVGGTVKVITACGTAYSRPTIAAGKLADPGFPYGSAFTLCATNGTRKRILPAQANTSFATAGTPVAMDVGTAGSTTLSPTSCP